MKGQMKVSFVFLLLAGAAVEMVVGITCKGFPGYCSESFPGQTCVVVCSKGRPNVPLCQEDGTWTDIPRCIEHDPGNEIQIPGLCPGISGYCSEGYLNQRCTFDCPVGRDIDSVCTQDGTWEPYPTCAGDLREVQDGCNPCPGPFGGDRNRTAEAILGTGPSARRKPKDQSTQDRIERPTFAGNQVFGPIPQKPTATQKPSLAAQRPQFTNQVVAPSTTSFNQRPISTPPQRNTFTSFSQQRPTTFTQQTTAQQRPVQRPAFTQGAQRPTFTQKTIVQRPGFSQTSVRRPGFSQTSVSRPGFNSQTTSVVGNRGSSSSSGSFGSDDVLVITGTSSQSTTRNQPSSRPAPPTTRRPPPPPPTRRPPVQQQQPRRIEPAAARPRPAARTPVPPPPQPVRPQSSGSQAQQSRPVSLFEEDDPSVPTIGGNTDDFFGAFQAVNLQGPAPPPPGPAPALPSFPAIPVSDRSGGIPRPPPDQFGPFNQVIL